MFLCVVVTKGAQLDQFDWPRTLRSQVSSYNIDYILVFIFKLQKFMINSFSAIIIGRARVTSPFKIQCQCIIHQPIILLNLGNSR